MSIRLPSIGWDPYQQRSGRDLTRNGLLGFVLFANANSVSEPDTDRFTYIHPAAGADITRVFI